MPVTDPESTLALSLREYFDNDLYSNLCIKDSNGHEYSVHRVIVCGQSPILANACKTEHGFKEAQTGVINLEHVDAGAVKAMLEYMYNGSYTNEDEETTMLFSSKSYAVGEIYCVPELKKLAAAQFKEFVADGWATADFSHALGVIYDSVLESDKVGIREIAADVFADHYDVLITKPEFEAVLDDTAALGKEVLKAMAKKKFTVPKGAKYKCNYTLDKAGYHIGEHFVWLTHISSMAYKNNIFCPSRGRWRSTKEWLLCKQE